ncbi:unnamed protein product [Cochlearia groenlandica]
MASGTARRVTCKDIQVVQNLIETCIQLYMNQKEAVDTLLKGAKIEPGFTELVWQKLEEENKEFFKAYYLRLMVKHQITELNNLLEQQLHHMYEMHRTVSNTNGSHIKSMNPTQLCYASEQTEQTLRPESAYRNGSSMLNTKLPSSVNISTHARRVESDASPSIPSSQFTNMPMMQGMMKSDAFYTNPASYMYGSDQNALPVHSTVGDNSVPSFNNQSLDDPLLDAEPPNFGYFGQIPWNFSLSDLTADFSPRSDILESYDRSPFLFLDSENFFDSRGVGEYQGVNKRFRDHI